MGEHIETEKEKRIIEDSVDKVPEDRKLLDERPTSPRHHVVIWSYVVAFFFTVGLMMLLQLSG